MANESDLLGNTVDGYAVGVNLTGTDDIIRLWRVTDGAAAQEVAASDIVWGSSDTMGVEVLRATNGGWQISIDQDGGFDGLAIEDTGTDTAYTDASHFGLAFIYTASRAGQLWMDDVLIQQGVTASGPPQLSLDPPGTSKSLRAGELLQFDVIAVEPLGDEAQAIDLWADSVPSGATFTPLSGTGPLTNTFSWTPDGAVTTNVQFLASDTDGTNDLTVTITVDQLDPGRVWINEVHYEDDQSPDVDEGVELAGAAGHSLADYRLVRYNGASGTSYGTLDLSGVVDNENGTHGAVWFAWPDLQNGAPDGIALVDTGGGTTSLLQFISYEGEFVASGGPADGVKSEDIGVAQSPSTATNMTIQLIGTGSEYDDFTWAGPQAASRGSINDGQALVPEPTIMLIR